MLNTIFHIDETRKWSVVISNLKHLHEWMQSNNESGVIELGQRHHASKLP